MKSLNLVCMHAQVVCVHGGGGGSKSSERLTTSNFLPMTSPQLQCTSILASLSADPPTLPYLLFVVVCSYHLHLLFVT